MCFFTFLPVVSALPLVVLNCTQFLVCAYYTLICNAFFVKCSSKDGNASKDIDAKSDVEDEDEDMEDSDSLEAEEIERLHSIKKNKLNDLKEELKDSKKNMENPTKLNDKAEEIKQTQDDLETLNSLKDTSDEYPSYIEQLKDMKKICEDTLQENLFEDDNKIRKDLSTFNRLLKERENEQDVSKNTETLSQDSDPMSGWLDDID